LTRLDKIEVSASTDAAGWVELGWVGLGWAGLTCDFMRSCMNANQEITTAGRSTYIVLHQEQQQAFN
jgi:hypothetical protein